MTDHQNTPQSDTTLTPPGVTVTPVTKQDVDAALRHLQQANEPFVRAGGPLSAKPAGGR